MEQLIHAHQQRKPPPFHFGEISLTVQKFLPLVFGPVKDLHHAVKAQLLFDAPGQLMLIIDKGAGRLHLLQHLLGEVIPQVGLVQGYPEGEDGLDKTDDQIAGLHMGLFPEKMNEHILSLMDLVKLGGDIAKLTLGANLIEKDRHQLGKLLGQVINGADGMVEQVGDISLKEIGVANAGSGEMQVNDQSGEQGRTPFGFLGYQVQPDTDIGEMGRVGDGLPVFIHAADAGVLKTKTHGLPQKGLNQT